MDNICRICAQDLNDSDGFNLFDNSTKSKKMLNRLKKIVGIELKNLRNMPDSICNKCQQSLEQAFQFRGQCRRVQTYLFAKSNHNIKGEDSVFAVNYNSFKDSCSEYESENEQKVVIEETHKQMGSFESVKLETEMNENNLTRYNLRHSSNSVEIAKKPFVHNDEYEEIDFESDTSSIKEELTTDKEWSLAATPEEKTIDSSSNTDEDEQIDFENTVKIPKSKRTKKNIQKSNNDDGITLLKKRGRKKKLKLDTNWKNDEKSAKCICELCGKTYSAQHYLISHMNLHKGITPYACELCPQKFHSDRNLKRHMMKHAGLKPYPCRYCERHFLDYYERIRHERVHTNERPSKCNYCDKAFTTNYILKNHLLTHTGERAFSCKICERSFSQKKNLATHFKSKFHKENEEKSKLNVALDI